MKEFLDQYRNGLVVLATIVLLIIGGYLVIRPLWLGNLSLMNQIQSLSADRELVQRQTGSLDDLKRQSEAIRSSADSLVVKMSESEPLAWVQAVEGLAHESGVSIKIEAEEKPQKIAPTKQKPKPQAAAEDDNPTGQGDTEKSDQKETLSGSLPSDRYVPVRFTIDGEYRAVRFFLEKLENLPFYVDVLSVSLAYHDPDEKHQSTVVPNNIFVAPPVPSVGDPPSEDASAVSPELSQEDRADIEAVFDAVVYTE